MMVMKSSPFSREKASNMKTSVVEACSSWESLKQALQVKSSLEDSQDRYVDADPLWINEGKLDLDHK
jgi:hypothetical protein